MNKQVVKYLIFTLLITLLSISVVYSTDNLNQEHISNAPDEKVISQIESNVKTAIDDDYDVQYDYESEQMDDEENDPDEEYIEDDYAADDMDMEYSDDDTNYQEDYSDRQLLIDITPIGTLENAKFVNVTGRITDDEYNVVVSEVDITLDDFSEMVSVDEEGYFNGIFAINEIGDYTVVAYHYSENGYASKSMSFHVNSLNTTRYPANILITYLSNSTYGENNLLVGKVVDENNNPLANKSLIFELTDLTEYLTTDNDGNFIINIRGYPGEYNAMITLDDFDYMAEPVYVNYTIFSKEYSSDLTLYVDDIEDNFICEYIDVKGHVVDNENNPVEDVAISITMYEEEYTHTDENGEFYLPLYLYEAGTYNLSVSIDGSKTTYNTKVNVKEHAYELIINFVCDEINVNDYFVLSGDVIDETGAIGVNVPISVLINEEVYETSSTETGELLFDLIFEEVGTYNLTVIMGNKSVFSTIVTVTEAEKIEQKDSYIVIESGLDILMNNMTSIKGYLYDEDDNPIQNVTLKIESDQWEYEIDVDESGFFQWQMYVGEVVFLHIVFMNDYYYYNSVSFNLVEKITEDSQIIKEDKNKEKNTSAVNYEKNKYYQNNSTKNYNKPIINIHPEVSNQIPAMEENSIYTNKIIYKNSLLNQSTIKSTFKNNYLISSICTEKLLYAEEIALTNNEKENYTENETSVINNSNSSLTVDNGVNSSREDSFIDSIMQMLENFFKAIQDLLYKSF